MIIADSSRYTNFVNTVLSKTGTHRVKLNWLFVSILEFFSLSIDQTLRSPLGYATDNSFLSLELSKASLVLKIILVVLFTKYI